MPPLPRNTCPHCKRLVPTCVNGAAREHRFIGQFEDGWHEGVCPGSGEMVLEKRRTATVIAVHAQGNAETIAAAVRLAGALMTAGDDE